MLIMLKYSIDSTIFTTYLYVRRNKEDDMILFLGNGKSFFQGYQVERKF